MTLVARRVQAIREQQGAEALDPAQPLADFRSTPAWVLLGEPGAGKSQALNSEAKATNGHYLTVADLLASDPLPEGWLGRTLYIDALDEVRAAGSESPLARIRNQLRRLGNPPFRLACRAADWYGPSDRGQLEQQSPNGQLLALQLCPLSQDDIRQILHDNHGVDDPQAFIQRAERHGIAPLLENPQTLELLAKAISGNGEPKSRSAVYRLACEKLAHEENKEHRDLQRQHLRTASDQQRLQAAGQLFAVLLLSGKSGIASDPDAASVEFPTLEQLAPTELQAAEQALHSKLFMLAPDHEERLIPSHRSIAEYLAATWLAGELDNKRLPLQRLLNLLLGADGGVVSDLRGLYAWLALHSISARTRLIEADPLSVILYGDARPMSLSDKRQLLQALQEQAKRFPGFRWNLMHDLHPFGALADEGLVEDFRLVLLAPERDEASQSHMDCVLDALEYGGASPKLADVLLDVVKDSSRWLRVRYGALHAWLTICRPEEPIALLRQIGQGRVKDDNDELSGILLKQLYPQQLPPDELLQQLHRPKNPTLAGMYALFWDYQVHELAPEDQLPILLDNVVARTELFQPDQDRRRFYRLADNLLVRSIKVHGDTITDERLFTWLGVGADEYGHLQRDRAVQQEIGNWFSERPERYKAILGLCIVGNEQSHLYLYNDRLHGARIPNDLGLWHLDQAGTCEEPIARTHLADAVALLIRQEGDEGLSLEKLEEWAELHPSKAEWLRPLLSYPLDSRRLKYAATLSQREKERIEKRLQRTEGIKPHLGAIRTGQARGDIFHQLACVWLDLFYDIHGQTKAERFADYCDLGPELMGATEVGLKRCLLRTDLPNVDEIIDLNLKQQRSWVSLPCQLGMDLLWQEEPKQVLMLPEGVLRRMITFQLTDAVEGSPEYFEYLVKQRPTLVADVLITYASAAFKAGKSSVSGIYDLAHNETYCQVAALAVPELLRVFPLRAKKDQLNSLQKLLKAALNHASHSLPNLVDNKLSLKSLDNGQRAYWLAAGLLIATAHYENPLLTYIGQSARRAEILAGFFCDDDGSLIQTYALPPVVLGRLIELSTPQAEPETTSATFVNDAMHRGYQVHSMIDRLASMPTLEAAQQLGRLLGVKSLTKLRFKLERARHQQRIQQREAHYRFLTVESVANILANREPANAEDLTALTLDLLEEVAHEIRHGNDDGFAAFWNISSSKPDSQREENRCRDALLTRLKPKLEALGIGIDPEVDHHNDKRADLRLDYRNQFVLPIEIKRDSNPELWTGLRKQLISQYANAPKSNGNGIYLVFWFGGIGMPRTIDGGKKPTSAEELRTRLEDQLSPEERQRIHIRVLDVSWPDR